MKFTWSYSRHRETGTNFRDHQSLSPPIIPAHVVKNQEGRKKKKKVSTKI